MDVPDDWPGRPLAAWPNLRDLVRRLIAYWPAHEAFLKRRFSDPDDPTLRIADDIGELLAKTAVEDDTAFAGYRWMCEAMFEEELHFRRTGRYRLSSASAAAVSVYDNVPVMTHYMRGLLVSQALWRNHSGSLGFYRDRFLPQVRGEGSLLEIGPGHGLLLYFAALRSPSLKLSGWDVSATSVAITRELLGKLDLEGRCELGVRDFLAEKPVRRFDAIVASELLEHLAAPAEALQAFRTLLAPDGRLYLNVPVNSPAPDHIQLWRAPEEVCRLVEEAGFAVDTVELFPVSGYTEAEARRKALTISCAIIARER